MDNIEKAINEGQIDIESFFEFIAGKTPMRTHLLEIGNCYACFPNPLGKDLVYMEKLIKLDYCNEKKFLTDKGSYGTINGNVFIQVNKKNFPKYRLIEGDNVDADSEIYKLVNKYLKERTEGNSITLSN